MTSRRFDAIIFDVGDTLLVRHPPAWEVLSDRLGVVGHALSPDTCRRAWKRAEEWSGEQGLRELQGAPRMPDADFDRGRDREALECVLPDTSGDAVEDLLDRLAAVPWPRQEWRLADRALETLAHLQEHGLALGIASNFDPTLLALCDSFGLTPYFRAIIVSSIVGVEKPDPEILRIACRELGVTPERALYVGDHPFDVLCAKAARMPVAWLCEADEALPASIAYDPDYRLAALRELIEWL
jgi:putative hydrolase of the HAD superfamily